MSRQARHRANGEVVSALELDGAVGLRAFRDVDCKRQATDPLLLELLFLDGGPA
ncbi:MAG TPA: hypothetical protein VF510_08480 [Ktedonobacterales bacterium]